MDINEKCNKEKVIVEEMINLYCKKNHTNKNGEIHLLCPKCNELKNYAFERSERCPFMENKTFCSNCKIHCYKPEMREQIKSVMKYSGPRMLLVHPIITTQHMYYMIKEKRKIKKEVGR